MADSSRGEVTDSEKRRFGRLIAALISNQFEVPGPSCICEPHTNSLFRKGTGG